MSTKSMVIVMIRLIKVQILVEFLKTFNNTITTKKFIIGVTIDEIVSKSLLLLQLLEKACVLLHSSLKIYLKQL